MAETTSDMTDVPMGAVCSAQRIALFKRGGISPDTGGGGDGVEGVVPAQAGIQHYGVPFTGLPPVLMQLIGSLTLLALHRFSRDGPKPGDSTAYIAFGRALGEMRGRIMDVHGAGSQRSDPKSGGPRSGRAPQGDIGRGDNFVRVVRGGAAKASPSAQSSSDQYPNNVAEFRKNSGESSWSPTRTERSFAESFTRPPQRRGFVQRLDRDGDNRVSQAEFDGPWGHFSTFDANGDGYLSEDEAPHRAGNGRPPKRW
ncbi:MAG: hypothetical protein ABW166_12855 [Sedimenticola sp.]